MLVHFPILLIVDDDPHILRFLQMNLERDGFEVRVAQSGTEALQQLRQKLPDLAIVDLLLPDMHGFELSRKIKSYLDIPIVMLTAVATEESAVSGLQEYAEDYIVKPFRYRELLARVNRVLTRTKHLLPPKDLQIMSGDLRLDFALHVALLDNIEVPLTPTECRLLACLARNHNRVVSRDKLIDEVWPEGEGDPLRLKVAIHRLRSKLEKDPQNPRYLLTHGRRGYMLATS